MMITVNKVHNDKTKVPDEFSFSLFRLFVLRPSSMSKLIQNQCTYKLILKTTVAYVYANEQLLLCFSVLVRHSVVLFVQL